MKIFGYSIIEFAVGLSVGWFVHKLFRGPVPTATPTPECPQNNSEINTTASDPFLSTPFPHPFPHPFMVNEYGFSDKFPKPKTTEELDLIKLSISIREKPNWQEKIKNPSIIHKWNEELKIKNKKSKRYWKAGSQLDYVLDELKYYEELKLKSSGSVEVAAVDGTWQSDVLIEEELRKEFMKGVAVLENVPEEKKDWHPGSNQVLDLVHPSLYPYVAKITDVTRNPLKSLVGLKEGERKLQYAPPEEIMTIYEAMSYTLNHTIPFPSYTKSEKFQWLPSEVLVDPDGKVRIASYINNLYPEAHADLYTSIERIMEKFIPLFNKVLTDLLNPRGPRIAVTLPSEEMIDEDGNVVRIPNRIILPKFIPPSPPSKVVDLKGRRLQIIVKIASIQLTPENPSYNGGVWHVEGMANERIVATGIYYYATSNIEESRLEFRQAVSDPDYEQNDFRGVERYYNISAEGTLANQLLGSILTKEGRCIAFPNILQHKVTPFKLADPTQPGFRKILVFFLVDPSQRILSTERVPPQQYDWLKSEQAHDWDNDLLMNVEIRQWANKKGTFLTRNVKKFREELMQERKYFVNQSNENTFERPISLCEH